MDWTDPLPVRRVERSRYAEVPVGPDAAPPWPANLPAVADVLARGIDLGRCTVLVGENGSGTSTLVEAIAMAYGLNAEGGSTGARHRTHESESPLHDWLTLVRGAGAPKWGSFQAQLHLLAELEQSVSCCGEAQRSSTMMSME